MPARLRITKEIATLGPKKTFSDLATKQFISDQTDDFEIVYLPTIKKVFNALQNECDIAVLPLENMSEGYVQITLDLLIESPFKIIHELMLPIRFACVSKVDKLSDVEKVYVQHITHGQCSEFFDNFDDLIVTHTHSNIESLDLFLNSDLKDAAIVPHHVIEECQSYPLIIENVTDYNHNKTRFVVLGKEETSFQAGKEYKTSLIILDDSDRPGLLSEILNVFTNRKINMTSLMSRPTRESLGNYHFYIDIEGHHQENQIKEALEEIQAAHTVNLIGSYLKSLTS